VIFSLIAGELMQKNRTYFLVERRAHRRSKIKFTQKQSENFMKNLDILILKKHAHTTTELQMHAKSTDTHAVVVDEGT
jgi:hypothetical protein